MCAVKKRPDAPAPDKLPGPINYKKPTGKTEDRPLEKIHQEHDDHLRAMNGDDPSERSRKP